MVEGTRDIVGTRELLRRLEIPEKAGAKLAEAIHCIGTGKAEHRGAPVLVAKLLNATVKHWAISVAPDEIGRRVDLLMREIAVRPYHSDTETVFTKLRSGLSARLARVLPTGTAEFEAFYRANPRLRILKHYESALTILTAMLAEKRLVVTR